MAPGMHSLPSAGSDVRSCQQKAHESGWFIQEAWVEMLLIALMMTIMMAHGSWAL